MNKQTSMNSYDQNTFKKYMLKKKKQHLKIRNVVCIGKIYLGDIIVFWEVDSHIQYGKRFRKSKVFIF